ncbi:uncharacterized protein LOC119840049 [Zerene cesonia]|uniref:uncharacterized protein LOC119840049 n=1 Tax=Zerene cesonia TaxID=33412 RepID=UPI0018E5370E|nr:uncharacterized protein LOC119840049 [Zerene cesonia]
MDSNGYETFEYLQPNNVEDNNQLFVLQNDGTFLSINRPVEFITQVQNVENVLEEVQPVYNVQPQQFYVDVNNSSELISVPDEYVLPTETNNMYSSNYLLQQPPNSSEVRIQQTVGQIAESVVEQMILPEINVPMDVNINDNLDTNPIQNNGCTEITITDEQYKILEQKGWVLVDTNDKVYLIDTLGFHDITNDTQLIQKLRAEMANQEPSYSESFASNQLESKVVLNEAIPNNINPEQVTIPYVTENSEQIDLQAMDIQSYQNIEDDPEILQNSEKKEVPDLMPLEKEFLETTINELAEKYEKSDPRINNNTIKIKTKFSLEEIPQEIIIGKTVNGKKLVARIAKPKEPKEPIEPTTTDDMSKKCKPKTYPTISAFHQKIEKIIQQAVRGHINPLSEEEVFANVDKVIQQLLRVPAFKPAVIERKLILTKIIISENKDQTSIQESDPIIITGKVLKQDEDKWVFHYIPDMLEKIKEIKEDDKNNVTKKLYHGGDVDVTFLQIHVQEVNSPDGLARISITLNKRVILLKSRKIAEELEKQVPSPKLKPVFACTACAAVFKTKAQLRCHLQVHKMDFDFDSLLTIHSKNSNNPFNVVELGQRKEFICNECQHKTSRVSMMLRHIRSHFKVTDEDSDEEDSNDSEKTSEGKYKCKMCSTNFLYASSLSKHLLSKHIKVS